jgi:hypothetical protein
MSRGRNILPPKKFWTPAEIARLRELYPDAKTENLVAVFGRPVRSIYFAANKNGIRKSAAYLASPEACRLRRGDQVGAVSRFPAGHVPFNKGLRRPGWADGGDAVQAGRAQGHCCGEVVRAGHDPRRWRGLSADQGA